MDFKRCPCGAPVLDPDTIACVRCLWRLRVQIAELRAFAKKSAPQKVEEDDSSFQTGPLPLARVGLEFGLTAERVSQVLHAYSVPTRTGAARFQGSHIERRVREVLADGPMDTGEICGALRWGFTWRASGRLAMLARRGVVVRVGRARLACGRGKYRNVWALRGNGQRGHPEGDPSRAQGT